MNDFKNGMNMNADAKEFIAFLLFLFLNEIKL